MAENGPLGPIFTLLDVSEQFVGDVKRGQDGAKIALKWSSRRLAEGKGASSISSRILRALAPWSGAQVAPRSVSRGSEERSACIRFAMHPLEASKSVAAEVDAKIGPKND